MLFDEKDMRVLVGRADACELFSRAFAFPDRELANALSSGDFQKDLISCLDDAGVTAMDVDAIGLEACYGEQTEGLLEKLRVAYSLMYLQPGGHTPIFPYEGAFMHVEEGKEDIPALFQTRTALDVERMMREAGVIPEDYLNEPCDRMSSEFGFLSFLYGNAAAALYDGRDDDKGLYERRAADFISAHLSRWAEGFFGKTAEFPDADVYAVIARFAIAFVRTLR